MLNISFQKIDWSTIEKVEYKGIGEYSIVGNNLETGREIQRTTEKVDGPDLVKQLIVTAVSAAFGCFG